MLVSSSISACTMYILQYAKTLWLVESWKIVSINLQFLNFSKSTNVKTEKKISFIIYLRKQHWKAKTLIQKGAVSSLESWNIKKTKLYYCPICVYLCWGHWKILISAYHQFTDNVLKKGTKWKQVQEEKRRITYLNSYKDY